MIKGSFNTNHAAILPVGPQRSFKISFFLFSISKIRLAVMGNTAGIVVWAQIISFKENISAKHTYFNMYTKTCKRDLGVANKLRRILVNGRMLAS